MKYTNNQMRVEDVVSAFNAGKINLIPPFQRGTVWTVAMRRRLIVNMVRQRPIPAIFLYKEAAGSKFSYNILDGKQRLESLMLFIGDKRPDFKIKNVEDYFFKKPATRENGFSIALAEKSKMQSFAQLSPEVVREFREYPIATIEIDLDSGDSAVPMDEIVSLFIDINTYGKKVKHFDIVRTMAQDPLLKQALGLIARREERKRSVYFKAMKSDFVFVLKRLSAVSRATDPNMRVDRMWERLTEIALFTQSQKHRLPADILKGFIKAKSKDSHQKAMDRAEVKKLRGVFAYLKQAYTTSGLSDTSMATDAPQFYTLATSLIATDLMSRYTATELGKKLKRIAALVSGKEAVGPLRDDVAQYKDLSSKQTTNLARRKTRQEVLIRLIDKA